MRIDSSGRLLLGTTTEGQAEADDLTIATAGITGITIRSGTSSNANIFFSDGTSGADEYRGIISYSHSSNSLNFSTNSSTVLTINSSGHVGIGITSPTSLLHLKSNAPYITFEDDDNNQDWQIQATAWFAIRDQTNNAERLRLDSAGRLLLGTTTAGFSYGDNLTIADSGDCGIRIRSGTSSEGNLFFSDGTSGNDQIRGYVQYNHSNNNLILATNAATALTLR